MFDKDPFNFEAHRKEMHEDFDRSSKSFDRQFRWIVIGIVTFSLIVALIFFLALSGIANSIQQQGGLGHAIGNFFHDVKESAK